jgi:hypothetical protein
MGLLAHAVRPSEPTLGRPPFFFLPTPGDVVPMVPNIVSCPQVLSKRAFSPDVLYLPILAKLSSAFPDLKWFVECYLALV